ncbi:M48 family metallopeptidase [Mucilaginibacter sp. L196]|uniref:tetratricopeptide repeat protein n=1 Tax=Mucilaginibacter sp. L196 TaxID=1641870 RepID=UPI00131C5119|nr:tetratricopeptide repeat protein [Mucilaginibacter sp. L196]
MKKILLTCFFTILIVQAFAQQTQHIDTVLKFDKRFTRCELKWVVMPKKDTSARYYYGFIYIDEMAGFTLDLKGFFTIDANGHYVGDTSMTRTRSLKYRLQPNTMNVALPPPQHFKELNIQPRPGWVNLYYKFNNDTSTFYNYRMGFNYNAAGDSETALMYLDKAYKANPHYKGLEFEVAYAYNALSRPDDAITVLENGVKYDPKNIMFYRELGYAYMNKKDYNKAIALYKQGISLYPDAQGSNETKAEMAFNLASVYHKMGKDDDYKEWVVKAKGWSLPNSDIYKAAVRLGF